MAWKGSAYRLSGLRIMKRTHFLSTDQYNEDNEIQRVGSSSGGAFQIRLSFWPFFFFWSSFFEFTLLGLLISWLGEVWLNRIFYISFL